MTQKDRNQLLYSQVQGGSVAAAEALITENMPLVVVKVGDFLDAHPQHAHLRDDLVSEGNVALVEWVQRLTRPHEAIKNLSGSLKKALVRAMQSLCDRDAGLGVCDRTMQRRRALAKSGAAVDELPTVAGGDNLDSLPESAGRRHTELREEIASCCKTDFERDVVRLREAGYVDAEIGEQLGKHPDTVRQARKRIEARYHSCYEIGA